MPRFYVTTPIYYVNDVPHLGTAYTTIAVDTLRRYHALRGDEARMLTGTDEHGLKLAQAAAEQGLAPKEFVDRMSARFKAAWPELGIEPDDFICTTEERHKSFVQELWKRVEANGDLYEGEYDDWYCVGCEGFKTEKELLEGNLCPIHAKPVTRLKEKTIFFRLSKWQEPLLDHYRKHPEFIQPETRRNEVLSFVEGGLRDLSLSRTSFSWGIPVPGSDAHVMYVWFDALANYRSALGSGELTRFWAPEARVVHLVGKDILRFHAVYWPAFLLAAGYKPEELPSQIFAHGFLTIDGQKMSKSLRNSVDPLRLAKELGPEVLRYQLLRAIAFGQDGDFDHRAMLERYNADLGKNLGNLLSRVLGLCTRLSAGKTPALGPLTSLDQEFIDAATKGYAAAAAEWDAIAPHRALEATWAISSAANQYVDRAAPWAEAKKGAHERTGTILALLLEVLRGLSVLMWPVLPKKSDALRAQLGLAPLVARVGDDVWPVFSPRPAGETLPGGPPLFPTLDDAAQKELLMRLMPKVEEPVAEVAKTEAKPAKPVAPSDGTDAIDYDTFANVDLRVGLVQGAERIPRKDKLLRLTVDVGEAVPRTIVAGIALSFAPEALVGRRVVVVANLAPRDFGKGLVSHGMLLATGPSDALRLATIDADVAPGSRLK